MFSWFFSSKGRVYRQFKEHLHSLVKNQTRGMNLDMELKVILTHGLNPAYVGPRPRLTGRGGRIYTPKQLEEVVKRLLTFEPEFTAYLVINVLPRILPRVISHPDSPETLYNLPVSFQGDLMMALEKIRAVAPKQVEQGASVMACALCMMPSLKWAKATYANLGVEYTEASLTEGQVEQLVAEKFVPDSTIRDTEGGRKRLVRDETIRRIVYEKLQELNPQVAEIIAK